MVRLPAWHPPDAGVQRGPSSAGQTFRRRRSPDPRRTSNVSGRTRFCYPALVTRKDSMRR